MPSDNNSPPSDQAELAGHRIWESVERRLWSRARLILAFVVIGIVLLVALGVPLLRNTVEGRMMDEVRSEIDAQIAANRVDVEAMRQQIHDDTNFVREQLIADHVRMGSRLGALLEQAEDLETKYAGLDGEAAELQSQKRQMTLLYKSLKNEQIRLHDLRTEYDSELRTFEAEAERMTKNAPTVIRSELTRIERIVERELDELRMVVADHTAGRPAMFSTYFDPKERIAQLTGVNFGEKPGRIFLRVRAFSDAAADPVAESESIMLQPSRWGTNNIEIRLIARVLEQIDEAEAKLGDAAGSTTSLRYGFMIQTAGGLMSKWSGMRADSVIPPERITPATEE